MIWNESSCNTQLSSHPRLHVVLQSGRLYLNHGSSCSPYRGPIPKYGRRSLQKLPCEPRKSAVVERWFDAWNGTLQVGKNLKDVTMHSDNYSKPYFAWRSVIWCECMPHVLCFPLGCGFPMLHHLTGATFDVSGKATGDVENDNISTSDPFKRPFVFPLIMIPCLLVACATVGRGSVYTLRQYDHASCLHAINSLATVGTELDYIHYRSAFHLSESPISPSRMSFAVLGGKKLAILDLIPCVRSEVLVFH